MQLFDERERTHRGPARHLEPTFRWLNRSAEEEVARAREVLEEWFSRYPEEEQADLRGRIRSSDDVQHEAAVFELLLHEVLLSLGCNVTVHPETEADADAQPDFLAEPPDGEPFYLEATIVTGKSDEERGAEKRKAKVWDLVDDLESEDFFLGVTERGLPARDPPTRRMRRVLEERMRELDPDEVGDMYEEGGLDALPRWTFELEGWEVEFYPIPKSLEARGPGDRTMGIWSPAEGGWVAPEATLRTGLRKKAGRYGELDRPFVIAVSDLQPFGNWESVVDALFGELAIVVPMLESGQPGDARSERVGNGLWYRGDHAGATEISAVLACLRLRIWSATRAPCRIYHNPWADRPLSGGLEPLPSVRVTDEGELDVDEGPSLGELAGLSEGWPYER